MKKPFWLSKILGTSRQEDSLEQIAKLSSPEQIRELDSSSQQEDAKSEVSSVHGPALFNGNLSVYETVSEQMSEGELQEQREWAHEMGLASGDFPKTKKVRKKKPYRGPRPMNYPDYCVHREMKLIREGRPSPDYMVTETLCPVPPTRLLPEYVDDYLKPFWRRVK